jgi:hypothetical protein
MTAVTPSSTSPSAPEVECDADEVEKALGNLKLFFDGEIVELTDYPELAVNTYEWQSQAVINAATNQVEPEPEAEEEQDLIEPPANPPLQFSQRSTLSTAQIAPQLADWQDDDEDIPF